MSWNLKKKKVNAGISFYEESLDISAAALNNPGNRNNDIGMQLLEE